MDGISLCSKNEIYIHHFLKIIPKAVRLYCIVLLRQAGRIKATGHMRIQTITCLVKTGVGLLILVKITVKHLLVIVIQSVILHNKKTTKANNLMFSRFRYKVNLNFKLKVPCNLHKVVALVVVVTVVLRAGVVILIVNEANGQV